MTKQTFWEDESLLIQLIVGEDWRQFKELDASSGINIETDTYLSQNGKDFLKLEEMAADMQKTLTSEYGKIFDSWQFSYNYEGGYEVLFENGISLVVKLPYILREELRFPQLEISTGMKGPLNLNKLPTEEREKRMVKSVSVVNTTSRFWARNYPIHYEPSDSGLVWISKTQISDTQSLQKLASDITEIYDSIKKSAEQEPEKIRAIYERLKNES